MAENLEFYRNQITVTRTEIRNLRQQLAALKHEHLKEIKLIKDALSSLKCSNCSEPATAVSPKITVATPSASAATNNDDVISYQSIGYIETAFHNKRGVPRQPSVMSKAKGAVVINTNIFNNPDHALSGLEEFSHMWIIFHFHATESNSVPAKVAPPRLGGERCGVFSTRSPHRPCPIGLSLVKIHSIEGNKINFLGVDMVNGTPVLDIKPYIPQYDYPAPSVDEVESPMTQVRPPTEGISDGTENMAGLHLDDGYAQRLTSRSSFEPDIASPNYDDEPSSETLESTSVIARNVHRQDIERGTPDGQERFTPPQIMQTNTAHEGVRIASWLSNPPNQRYEVRFTDDVNNRLNEVIGDRAQAFKANIQSLLADDPRSTYVKTRYPDHEYSCVLEDLSISCVFDASQSICMIIAIRSADDMNE